MALSKALVQPFRKNKLKIGAGWRAFFAPYDPVIGSGVASTVLGPTILDLTTGPYNTYSPPAGFFDTGWLKDFKFTPASKIGQVRSGYRGAIRAQYRGEVGETFEFKWREYSRLQYRLASGTNVINLLSGATPTTAGPLSASGAATVAMVSYSAGNQASGGVTPATLTVAAGSGASFAVGDYIVCDKDYDVTTYGIVGSVGVPVFKNAVTDVDYIRKNSDFVARVTLVVADVLTLDQPFAGGGANGVVAPAAGSKVQKIKGWAAREGGTYISEWSGLFVLDTEDTAQIVVYYPHVSIMQNRDMAAPWAIENQGTTDQSGYEMDAQFQALAFDDPLDGETVVGYRCYFPAPGEQIGY